MEVSVPSRSIEHIGFPSVAGEVEVEAMDSIPLDVSLRSHYSSSFSSSFSFCVLNFCVVCFDDVSFDDVPRQGLLQFEGVSMMSRKPSGIYSEC